MSRNPRLARLEPLIGRWEMTAVMAGRTMSVAVSTISWLDGRDFLTQRTDPQSFLVPEWVGAAPEWTDSIIGADDYSDAFTMLYADARGVCRTYAMTLDDRKWTMTSRPGGDFHQRFEGTVGAEAIEGAWQRSADGQKWETDFDVMFRRLDPGAIAGGR